MDYDDLEQHELDDLFSDSCQFNNLINIKYLIKLNYVDIHYDDDYGLRLACKHNHLNIVKYLLDAPDLKEHANIHAKGDEAFKNAYTANHLDIINYLIIDYKIPRTKEIEELLSSIPKEDIKQLFDKRDLNQILENELDSDKIDLIKKIKL